MSETVFLLYCQYESGHYYFDVLLRDSRHIDAFRALFGDERADYAAALQQYYQSPPPADGGEDYISAYARAHPVEDWAETWAHYLLMIDTLETAVTQGLLKKKILNADFARRVSRWIELSMAMNSLNRSVGLYDGYPFVLSPAVVEKLRFVETVVNATVAERR